MPEAKKSSSSTIEAEIKQIQKSLSEKFQIIRAPLPRFKMIKENYGIRVPFDQLEKEAIQKHNNKKKSISF